MDISRTVSRYIDAARTLRPTQVLHRPRRLIPPRILATGPSAARPLQPLPEGLGVEAAPQFGPQAPPHLDATFRAAGARRSFPAIDFWTDESDGLLFLFHLHGFADLPRAPREARPFWEEVVENWEANCRTPATPAWHPFPTSGRIIAWCSNGFMQPSLPRQLTLLRRSVEHDIGGNHVIRNAAALVIGGTALGDRRAFVKGRRTLERELPSQILSDGGHEERSPSYHRVVLSDLRDVARVADITAVTDAIPMMEGWLAALAGPDGGLPLFNDAWEGPPVAAAEAPFADLAQSGYVVLRHGRDQIAIDAAPLAPRHLPAHAHADALSFVLWLDGAPVVVDPGVYAYTGPERARFRSTAAHATVEIGGRDQADLWGDFRMARAPRVRQIEVGPERVVAEHDGYAPVIHRRTFAWRPGRGVVIVDRLIGPVPARAVSRLPLARDVRVVPLGDGGAVRREPGAYAPYLGTRREIDVITRDIGALSGWAVLHPGATLNETVDGLRVSVP